MVSELNDLSAVIAVDVSDQPPDRRRSLPYVAGGKQSSHRPVPLDHP